jgi:hypothetical protein
MSVMTAPRARIGLRVSRGGAAAVLLAWGGVVAWGFGRLLTYAQTPGERQVAAAHWPAESSIPRDAGRPALLMFVHPRCPCSHASLAELARIMSRIPGRAGVGVVFVRPAGLEAGWEQARLWRAAADIPGLRMHVDAGGVEAARFGATISGCALLYDASGALVFRGGITSARGHEGDSAGKQAILAWFESAPRATETPVFGCPLFEGAPPCPETACH